MPINTPSYQYERVITKIVRCRDCFQGSDAIKAKGTIYLPPLASQDPGTGRIKDSTTGGADSAYEQYKRRALFVNATARAVIGLSGLVLQKTAEVVVPASAEGQDADITLAGESLEQFIANTFIEDLITGGYGILIDVPRDHADGESRPYWQLYKREQIISFRQKRIGGKETLIHVVLMEKIDEPKDDDPYVTEPCEQYRELYLDNRDENRETLDRPVYRQQVWRMPDKKKSEFERHGDPITPMRGNDPLHFIPFVKPDEVKPPLLDLVIINIAHYMMSADYKHGLHMVALPTPYIRGRVKSKGDGAPLRFGPGVVFDLSEGGGGGMIEFTGAGLSAIRDDLNDMMKQMAMVGARLIEDTPSVAETATAVAMRHAGEHASLRAEVGFVEADLSTALQIHGWWEGLETEVGDVEDASVVLNKDFFDITMDPQLIQQLLTALLSGKISERTWWYNLRRGGLARPATTWEDEQETIVEESAQLPLTEAEDNQ